jgi:hypothetical protein
VRREDDIDQARMAYGPDVMACQTIDRMKSREEQLTWAKQRAVICVDMGRFSDAVAGLRTDLAENPLTKGVISSEHAMRGYKAAMDAALGRSSQALTEWIEGFRQRSARGPQPQIARRRKRGQGTGPNPAEPPE